MLRFCGFCGPRTSPLVASPAWEKCYSFQYSWVRPQGARRSPWYFGKGRTDSALAREPEFSETSTDSVEH